MPYASVNGVNIYYEVIGAGFPVVFCHEFAGDYRSWAPQVEAVASQYRCITFSYRGYPPSEVPEDPEHYGQDILVEDLLALMDHLEIEQAHIVGLSMGGNVVLQFAFTCPERCRSIVVAGCGGGSTNREQWARDITSVVELLNKGDMGSVADVYSRGATRVPFMRKDPEGWDRFRGDLAEHSALGSAHTMSRVQRMRPSVFLWEEELEQLEVPALIIVGDEDEPCIDPSVFMKRAIPWSGLLILPQTGHTINLEEPEAFNRALLGFWRNVEQGTWSRRESLTTSLLPEDPEDSR